MWGIAASPVQWICIHVRWQFILYLCYCSCDLAALNTVDTLKLCRGCRCIKCHTRGVGTCRWLCTQGCVDVVFDVAFVTPVSVASVRSCGVCRWYSTTTATTQLWCPSSSVTVLVLPLQVPCASIFINIILIFLPWSHKNQTFGTSEETAHTLHAFLKVGKSLLCI